MRTILLIVISFLLATAVGFARDAESVKIIPGDFDEIDFGTAVEFDHFKVLVSTKKSLTGTATGGVWIGRQLYINLWVADAEIPKQYARSHKGVFYGTYTTDGTGPGEPPKWKGGGSAGHLYIAPMIVDFKYIHAINDLSDLIDDTSLAYIAKYPTTNVVSVTALAALITGLYYSTNPEPSSSFNNEADWQLTGVKPQETRGFSKLAISIEVNKDNEIIDNKVIGNEESAGWTPFPITRTPVAGDYGTVSYDLVPSKKFVIAHKHVGARLSWKEALLPNIISLSTPYIWSDILYRVNSDGTYLIFVADSHAPTTHIYKSETTKLGQPFKWTLYKGLFQEDFPKFMVDDVTLVEAPEHSDSPTMISGVAEAQ